MNIDQLALFFGYCSLVSYGVLLLSFLLLVAFKNQVVSIHSKLMDVKEEELPKLYFNYLAYMKLIISVFNFVPFLVLKFLM